MIDPKKIIIGTAQFGRNYGVTNFSGRTRLSELKKIINESYKNNINFFDTAPSYGDAEEKLGRCLKKSSNIVTKLIGVSDKQINERSLKKIRVHFYKSLKNLNLNRIYGVLIHSTNDIYKKNFKLIVDFLKDLKKRKLIKKIGISIYEKKDFDQTLKIFKPDIVQLPINIADQRLLDKNFLKEIKRKNIEIHARSIFLQGILISKKNKLPPSLKKSYQEYYLDFHNKLKEKRITAIEACLYFISSIKEIDKIVIGVDTLSQLKEILRNNKKKSINSNIFKEFKLNNLNIVNPLNWKK